MNYSRLSRSWDLTLVVLGIVCDCKCSLWCLFRLRSVCFRWNAASQKCMNSSFASTMQLFSLVHLQQVCTGRFRKGRTDLASDKLWERSQVVWQRETPSITQKSICLLNSWGSVAQSAFHQFWQLACSILSILSFTVCFSPYWSQWIDSRHLPCSCFWLCPCEHYNLGLVSGFEDKRSVGMVGGIHKV